MLAETGTSHNYAFLHPCGRKEGVNARRPISPAARPAANPPEPPRLGSGAVCRLPERTRAQPQHGASVRFRGRALLPVVGPTKDRPSCRNAVPPKAPSRVSLQVAGVPKEREGLV